MTYKTTYTQYENAISKCCKSSQYYAGIKSPTSSHFYASLLFTKLCNCAKSIGQLCPKPTLIGNDAHWDYSSVSSLTRDLIECYLTFYYLCIEECSKDEWNARWQLMNLHDHMSRVKMFEALGDDYEKTDDAKNIRNEVISNLKSNPWFSQLPEKQKTHYLKGKNAFFKSKGEIISASGEDPDFRFKYIFASNHTHTLPMGFYRMADGNRGRGIESEIEVLYTGQCLEWVAECLLKANLEFNTLFKGTK
ncbi:MAG: DUF5677 domain-containing protein [Desulfotalea sp.]